MKLRNKKTGVIKEVSDLYFINKDKNGNLTEYGEFWSIKELNEEWEDYEEPKEYWYIEPDGSIMQNHKPTYINHLLDGLKSIGNYFETKEEAEKAVEKLKAWKKLKDKGFGFDGYDSGHNSNKELCGQAYFKAGNFWFDIKADLDLFFGGEE